MPLTQEEKLKIDFKYILQHADAAFLKGAIEVLQQNEIEVWENNFDAKGSVLIVACETHNSDKVQIILDNCPLGKIEGLVQGNETKIPLIILLQTKNEEGIVEGVRALLSKGANSNSQTVTDGSAVGVAVSQGHIECLKILLNYGANVNMKDAWGKTPIYKAAEKLNIEMIQALLAKDARLDLDEGNILSAICLASNYGYLKGKKTASRTKAIRALFEANSRAMNDCLTRQYQYGLNQLHNLVRMEKGKAIKELCFNANLKSLNQALKQKFQWYSDISPSTPMQLAKKYNFDKKLKAAIQLCQDKTKILEKIDGISELADHNRKFNEYEKVLKEISELEAKGNTYITRLEPLVIGKMVDICLENNNIESAIQRLVPIQDVLVKQTLLIVNKILASDAVVVSWFANKQQERYFAARLITDLGEEKLSDAQSKLRQNYSGEAMEYNPDFQAAKRKLEGAMSEVTINNLEYQLSVGSMSARAELYLYYFARGKNEQAQNCLPDGWNPLQLIASNGRHEHLRTFCELTPPRELLAYSLQRKRRGGFLSSNQLPVEMARGNKAMGQVMFQSILYEKLCFFRIHQYFCSYGLKDLPGFKDRLKDFAKLLRLVTKVGGFNESELIKFFRDIDPISKMFQDDCTFYDLCRNLAGCQSENVSARAQEYLEYINQEDIVVGNEEQKVITRLKQELASDVALNMVASQRF